MVDSGALDGRRVELIVGQIVEMSPASNMHRACIGGMIYDFGRILPKEYMLWSQQGIAIESYHSQPEPDLAVLRLRDDRFALSAPTPLDVVLLIEVADSSLLYDREKKAPLYAAGGVQEYWIINLKQRQLERCVLPEGGEEYPEPEVFAEDDSLTHALLGEVKVAGLLPMQG